MAESGAFGNFEVRISRNPDGLRQFYNKIRFQRRQLSRKSHYSGSCFYQDLRISPTRMIQIIFSAIPHNIIVRIWRAESFRGVSTISHKKRANSLPFDFCIEPPPPPLLHSCLKYGTTAGRVVSRRESLHARIEDYERCTYPLYRAYAAYDSDKQSLRP